MSPRAAALAAASTPAGANARATSKTEHNRMANAIRALAMDAVEQA